MTEEITNRRDLIDSREVEERIQELQGELDCRVEDALEKREEDAEAREALAEAPDALEDLEETRNETFAERAKALGELASWLFGGSNDLEREAADAFADGKATLAELDRNVGLSDEADELRNLLALKEEAEGYCEWGYGATFVRADHFVEYCQELVQDIGDLPRGIPSYIEIDWEKTAENIKMDYTSVEFAGVEYYIR